MTVLSLNQVAFGLGAGVLGATDNRMGVWTQGCSLPKCPGCTSKQTWSPDAGKAVGVDALVQLAVRQAKMPTGVTISGGEPTDQADEVAAFIRSFRTAFPGTEVVLYSGRRWPVLTKHYPELVAQLDVAITGPFVHTLDATPLTGSNNQEVNLLTPLAEHLYKDWERWPRHVLQVGRGAPAEVVTVGIPHTPRMARAAEQTGAITATWNQPSARNHDE